MSEEEMKPESDEDMQAQIARLQAENADLKKKVDRSLTFKVSQKGGVSVYGLGRFPVTLYKEQWLKLLDVVPALRTFIEENDAQLKTHD